MLYGNEKIQKEIINQIEKFEKKFNKKVVFGAMVGSISKGVERYDSDYDTRFLYLDKVEDEYIRWDKTGSDLKEEQIHYCYVPEKCNCYANGREYRKEHHKFDLEDKSLFYDKIAFWELTSFLNFLKVPVLDNKFSVGLYHIVSWTFNSPFCWDPYGIGSKISCLLDEMFRPEYEIQYYRNYILRAQKKDPLMLREYLYSAYYALAIQYCMKNHRFAPVCFETLLALCDDEILCNAILKIQEKYYGSVTDKINMDKSYERKMTNTITVDRDGIIEDFLHDVLQNSERYDGRSMLETDIDYVDEMIEIILGSLKRPVVKDVNEMV